MHQKKLTRKEAPKRKGPTKMKSISAAMTRPNFGIVVCYSYQKRLVAIKRDLRRDSLGEPGRSKDAHTHTYTHTHIHPHTNTHLHIHTHIYLSIYLYLSISISIDRLTSTASSAAIGWIGPAAAPSPSSSV